MIQFLPWGNFPSKTAGKKETTTTIPWNLLSLILAVAPHQIQTFYLIVNYFQFWPEKVFQILFCFSFWWENIFSSDWKWLLKEVNCIFVQLLNWQIAISHSSPMVLLAGHTSTLPCSVIASPDKQSFLPRMLSCISEAKTLSHKY